MGLTDWVQGKVLGSLIKPVVGPILKGIEWLNAYPGRKRGVAAILLGFGTPTGLRPGARRTGHRGLQHQRSGRKHLERHSRRPHGHLGHPSSPDRLP